MKKFAMVFLLAMFALAGCGKSDSEVTLFNETMAKEFEIVKYQEAIAPVYENLVPYIAYAQTAGQLEELKKRFDVGGFDIDTDQYMAVFVATYSDGCGVQVDNVYDRNGLLSVQLIFPKSDSCDKDAVPHTFVIQVPKGDYTKVQLYDGVVLKSTIDIKE